MFYFNLPTCEKLYPFGYLFVQVFMHSKAFQKRHADIIALFFVLPQTQTHEPFIYLTMFYKFIYLTMVKKKKNSGY